MSQVQQRSFDDLSAPLYEVPFCVLDLETTGGSAASCEITEIGAVKYVSGELVGTFHTLVNPGTPIPPFITVLTGITQIMVIEAPRIEEALPSLLEFIGDAVVVGHNVRFDLSFLNAAAIRLGYGKLPNRSSDTAALARRLVRSEVRNLKLGTLAAHFRSPTTPTHRALDDAKATAHIFWSLLERVGSLGVTHLDDLMALPTAKGAAHYGKIELTEALPRKPGVYLFIDGNGNTIYVGKAKNLRTRVRSYFYGDTRKSVTQMLRDLEKVDYRVCTTDLEAEITELRLIKAHLPRYNRRSRPARSPHWIKLTSETFPRLSMVRKWREDGCLYLGPYRSRRSAEVVVHALWDAVPIRRCHGTSGKRTAACGFSQLGVALCPCNGDLDPAVYSAVIERLRDGIDHSPAELLEALAIKMAGHARNARFEEAAAVRDRYRALARSLQRRRAWVALQAAGMLWAEDAEGEGVLLERGRLVASWVRPDGPPLLQMGHSEASTSDVPASVQDAEECHLLWKWLDRDGVRIIDSGGPLVYPAGQIRPLERLAS